MCRGLKRGRGSACKKGCQAKAPVLRSSPPKSGQRREEIQAGQAGNKEPGQFCEQANSSEAWAVVLSDTF